MSQTLVAAQGRVHRDAVTWQRIITEQQASGLSQRAFCQAQGIGLSTLQRWRQALKHSGARAPARVAAPFIALEREAVAPSNWALELELGGGVTLRLRRA
jgi:hypothetical protein